MLVKAISDSSLITLAAPVLLTLCLCAAPPARAQAPTLSVVHNVPVSISADTMTYEPEKDRVIFRGNVEATRAQFIMWSDLLTLYLKPSAKASSPTPSEDEGQGGVNDIAESAPSPALNPNLQPGDLDRIVAEKNVRFRYNTQNGTAAKATYTLDTGVLVMDGNPILRDGENSITGSRILYFLNENRSEVESGPQRRVEAVFGSGSLPGKAQ